MFRSTCSVPGFPLRHRRSGEEEKKCVWVWLKPTYCLHFLCSGVDFFTQSTFSKIETLALYLWELEGKKRGIWTTGLVFRVIPITDFWGKEKSFILNLMPWFSTTWCVRWWSSLCQFPEIFEISLDQGLFPRIVWTMWWYSKLRNDSADGERELWLTKAPQRRLIKDTWKTAFDPKT